MRPYLWLLLISIGPIALLVLKLIPTLDQFTFHNALSHILISGDASLLGAALAVLMLRVAYRAWDARIFLVGMGFLSTASMLIVHYRLSTPSPLLECCNHIIAWSPLLSLALGGLFFALSGLDLSARANRRVMRQAGIGLVIYLVVWLIYSWFFLVWAPSLAIYKASPDNAMAIHAQVRVLTPDVPTQTQTIALASALTPTLLDTRYLALGVIGLACYSFAARQHYRLFRHSPSPAGLAITCGITLFGEALLTALFSQLYTPSFWLYHVELAAGFSTISYAILRTYHHGQTDESLMERLFLAGTRTRMHVEYALAMDALIVTLACAEQPTPALRQTLQRRFGLTESQIEVLEQAAAAIAQERRQRRELQQFNANLQQLEENKNLFTQMLVHDLKNPLAAQIGCLELMQREPLTEYQRQLLESALRSGKNLSDLISTLLDVTRLEEGGLELDHSLVPPRDLLNVCGDELRGWATEEHKQLLVDVADDLPLLQIDLQLMRRVLLNLLSNAIKHTPAGTRITLRAYPASQSTRVARSGTNTRVIVEVADTGPGIPAEYLERIFEKFVHVGGARRSRYDNTGLGLTFCRLVVEAHGGAINATSTVGVETTFRFDLPAR